MAACEAVAPFADDTMSIVHDIACRGVEAGASSRVFGLPIPGRAQKVSEGRMAIIELTNVTMTYGRGRKRRAALDRVSVSVEEGAFAVLMGPSGAGKSTLLKLVLAMERPDEGTIRVAGRDIQRLRKASIPYLRRNVGAVFQDFKLLPDASPMENVALSLHVLGLPRREVRQRAARALARVELEAASGTLRWHALGDGLRSTVSALSRPLSRFLVVSEIALAFTLLSVSAILIQQLDRVRRVALCEPDRAQPGGGVGEQGTQPLAAAECAVAHRLQQATGREFTCGYPAGECGFGALAMRRTPLIETGDGHQQQLLLLERLEHIAFEHAHLLLDLRQFALCVLQQFGATLVRRQRISQRQAAAFEVSDQLFQLVERGFKGFRGGFGHDAAVHREPADAKS